MSFKHLHSHPEEPYDLHFRECISSLKICHLTLQELRKEEHWRGIVNENDTRTILQNIGKYSDECKSEANEFHDSLLQELKNGPDKWILSALDELNPLCTTQVGSEYALYIAAVRHLRGDLRSVCFESQCIRGKPIKVITRDKDNRKSICQVKIELCDQGIKITRKEPNQPIIEYVFMDECLMEFENNEPVQNANSNETIQSLKTLLWSRQVEDHSDESD